MRIYCSSIDSNNGIFVHGDGSSDPLVGCDRGIRNIVGIRRKTSALFHEWTDDPSFILSQQVTAVVVAAIKEQYRLRHTSTFSQLNYLYFYFRSTYTHFPRIFKFLHSLHKHIRTM